MLTEKIKAIIVDDEKPSRLALLNYITDYCPDVELVAECESVKTAYHAILEHRPQLVFLDIEMPNGSGFDLLQKFKNPDFRVIFVTAFSDYAIRAFRFAAIDYLLKPVKVDELVEAVQKVKSGLVSESSGVNMQVLLDSIASGNGKLNRIVLPDTKGFTVVKFDELIMCEADGYCTVFYLTGKRKITCTRGMKYFEEVFDQKNMVRVHRSFLVNIEKVKGVTKQGEIILEDDISCPLGNNHRQQFLERFGL